MNDFLTGQAVVEGQPVGTFYSYKFVGLSSEDGGPIFEDWEDRQSEIENLNNYEAYTKVLVPSGKREPDITGSLSNTFTYKQWRLGITFTYSFGASTRLFRLYDGFTGGYSSEANVNRDLMDRWQRPGDEAHNGCGLPVPGCSRCFPASLPSWAVATAVTGSMPTTGVAATSTQALGSVATHGPCTITPQPVWSVPTM